MSKVSILWADDEIETLKPLILYLEKKDYQVIPVSNGHDALDKLKAGEAIDVIFLDESMPGITGLEVLERIKKINTRIPVVMITKNEQEDVMEEAIGSQIDDYLIKPVKPAQVLLTIKKMIDNKRLVLNKTESSYQQEFRELLMFINEIRDLEGWQEVYRRIVNWELRLDRSASIDMQDILNMQKTEANAGFSKYVEERYRNWITDQELLMSNNLIKRKVLPHLKDELPVVFLLLDNLRYDQWKIIEPLIADHYRIEEEDFYLSILPTSTQYSRNAIFAGMMPGDIAKHYPEYWKNDAEEGGKNMYEEQLLGKQLDRLMHKEVSWSYRKISRHHQAKQLEDSVYDLLNNNLSAVVYNFIDMLSHARTEMEVLKELAGDERAYRGITLSWFRNSSLWNALKRLSERPHRLIITTDHGTIRVNQPSKVVADRDTTTNLRYKVGKKLKYKGNDVLAIKEPEKYGLPRPNLSSTFIFAKEDKFFLYPNNYNYYNNYYKDTFQHGGISLEEMLCPYVSLVPR
ncbi:MAG TPA: bifunctional response regulator/alkaline phosphatase family protein [Saprospiraceae bacterium]|nr:bifunctional response regulator/alkaline phosphatase family protein [Saprospiraceae bacterium]